MPDKKPLFTVEQWRQVLDETTQWLRENPGCQSQVCIFQDVTGRLYCSRVRAYSAGDVKIGESPARHWVWHHKPTDSEVVRLEKENAALKSELATMRAVGGGALNGES